MDQRKYHSLRAEVNNVLGLIRALNRTALTLKTAPSVEKQFDVEAILYARQDAVNRMADVADKIDAEMAEQRANLTP